VSDDIRKLTTYFGERARADGGFLADALVGVYARHRLRTSVVLRGIAGFGAANALRTDRLLSLSEDLPMVAVAVDERARIDAALHDVRALPRFGGLVTVEGARLPADPAAAARGPAGPSSKLSVFVGRQERAGGRPAHVAIVELLRRCGIDGATAFLGIDGTVGGERRRARFFARNAAVPMMVVAVGDAERVTAALRALPELHPAPLVTLERVQVCKRDGVLLERPGPVDAPAAWQKLMVYTSERAAGGGAPLHRALVAELRRTGAPGATTVRGTWGYHGDRAPHGDRLWQLRRHVPVVTTILDRPEGIARWFDVVDRLTAATGLVTCEVVPEVLRYAGVDGDAA
jgi:PII-like signaling protein